MKLEKCDNTRHSAQMQEIELNQGHWWYSHRTFTYRPRGHWFVSSWNLISKTDQSTHDSPVYQCQPSLSMSAQSVYTCQPSLSSNVSPVCLHTSAQSIYQYPPSLSTHVGPASLTMTAHSTHVSAVCLHMSAQSVYTCRFSQSNHNSPLYPCQPILPMSAQSVYT